ncbi:M23 family metallopeptidase [Brachyspira hyodysenteriae]|uniref:Metalloendopeptidase n=1 Tax=Brachyspira hyodysenteriae ATCC 27164 TaxID=1266923 RepID=A0A3B6VTP2_BRAHO|nr:M23 family metallopeptidase [Brachyspira hyodysenteriae]ANN64514.1 metalloendopeptidase [Brachyspira hyodysenteriae ATCC 27164]AUJ49078.1 metalloendopeptidase [Brachyspira hyodysenteriae]KLI14045.1 metalloendopeptidase [Brachyspira hyodysenteriae]KLI14081.1 metalloendopeptidase [Brachyspira hyodysenteriae]KLI15609.1 metalloendopeptidase [Brachyspira hyodysenteriae]
MKNNKFKYTKIRNNNNIISYMEDILFKIKSKFIKSNNIQRIRTTYVHSTRYTGNDKKNNIFLTIIKKFSLAVVSLSLFMILANFLIINMRHTSKEVVVEDKMLANNAYSKILDEISPEQVSYNTSSISEVPTVTSAVTLENATDIFYNSITSDNTLVGDGTIGMKYDEYIIEEGDNLTTISRKIGANLDTLVSVNKITNANRLRPGQKIVIPNRNGLLYTIKKDESIEEIAERYDVSLNRVLSFNKISDPNDIEVGDDIFLPGAKYTLDERIDKFGQMFSIPTTITRISSVFGYRVHPITGVRTKHMGVDIPGRLNTPVYAARKGKVIFAGYSGGYGNLVIVRHDKGYTTYYGHLNSITTRAGATVGVGVMIGRMGSTGRSTGSHLHFEVRRNGVALNPADFIPIKKFLRGRR